MLDCICVAFLVMNKLFFCTVIFAIHVEATVDCDHHTIHMAVNSTSFPCPLSESDVNCNHSMTLKQLSGSKIRFYNKCSNEFIFQPKAYVLERRVTISFAATTELVVRGENTSMMCEDDTKIIIKSALNITVSGIHFQYCTNILVIPSNEEHSSVVIANCRFTSTRFILGGTNKKLLQASLQNINLISGFLTFNSQKSGMLYNIIGQGSSITCENAPFIVHVKPRGIVRLLDVNFFNCNNIAFVTQSKQAEFQINNVSFYNSCLKFEAALTRSHFHYIRISMIHTKVERCTCKFIQLFTKINNITIILRHITVIRNYLPFIESENNPVSVTVMGH